MGKDFNNADKGKSFKKGGDTMASKMNPGFMAMMAKKKGATKMAGGGSVDVGNSTSMGKVRTASPSKDGIASKGKTKGMQVKMAGNSIGTGKAVNTMKKGGMAYGGKC